MFRRTQTSRPEVFSREYERNDSTGFLRFPDKPNPHSILLVFKEYDYKAGFGDVGSGQGGRFAEVLNARTFNSRSSGVSLRSVNSIELPFPKQLADTTQLKINAFERDILTEQIASRINNYIENGDTSKLSDMPDIIQSMGAGFSQLLGGATAGNANDVLKSVLDTSIADVVTSAQYLLRSKLPGDISRSIDTVTGQTINPRETLAFEGVTLRTHSFNWDLFPNNVQDSNRIQEIINMIKRNILPTTQSLKPIGNSGPGVAKAFLRYPSTVEMYLLGVSKEHYIKFKPAMVTSFNVDYNAGGNMSFLKGGKPAGVNLALLLTELEIETAEDYGAASGSDVISRASATASAGAGGSNGNQQ